jgi:hypothetical protein
LVKGVLEKTQASENTIFSGFAKSRGENFYYTDFTMAQSQMTLAELVQDFERTSLTYLTMREGLSFPGGE